MTSTRINVSQPLGDSVNLAFSGGVDSLGIALFLKESRKNVTLFHYNHGCPLSDEITEGCIALSAKLDMPLITAINNCPKPDNQSQEDFWRECRYRFLRSYDNMVVCHTMDDVIETWIWSSLHGTPKLIPERDEDIIRPFLFTNRESLENRVKASGLSPVPDASRGMRNYIRDNMVHHALHVNPGLRKVLRKKYLDKREKDGMMVEFRD